MFNNEEYYKTLPIYSSLKTVYNFWEQQLQISQYATWFIIIHLWLQIYHFRHVWLSRSLVHLHYINKTKCILTSMWKLLVWLAESKVKVNLTLQRLRWQQMNHQMHYIFCMYDLISSADVVADWLDCTNKAARISVSRI